MKRWRPKEQTRWSRWFTVRGSLNRTFAYYSFTSLPSYLEEWFAFTARKLQCCQSYLTCLYSYIWSFLFIRQVGTRAHLYWASVSLGAKNSFALDCRVFYLTGQKIYAVYIIFIFFLFVESRPSFKAIPPDPFYVLEGNNITLVWQYNLDGTFDRLVFQFSGSSPTTILVKYDINVDAVVSDSPYQNRIQENINTTRAEIAIFALQRNESGGYEIDLTNKNFLSTSDRVTV